LVLLIKIHALDERACVLRNQNRPAERTPSQCTLKSFRDPR
jgi:hypothetical protein